MQYAIERHPLIVLAGYLTVFLYKQCLQPLAEDPRRYWDSAVALGLHVALTVVLWHLGGAMLLAFVLWGPLAFAMGFGTYLFYAQHTCQAIEVAEPEDWTFVAAALKGSSFMEGGPLLHWFTGNIGYHHVHHLNPRIPFYRLPEAMRALPELRSPPRTSLRPREVLACLGLRLWDAERRALVEFPPR